MENLTESKLKRMSIDQIGELLDQHFDSVGENHPTYKLIERVLESKEAKYIEAQDRVRAAELEKQEKLQALKIQITNMLQDNPIRKMDAIYQSFGEQFINDYIIDEESCIIKSMVASEHQNDMWQLEDIDALNRKLKSLVYDRVYDHYIRRGSYGMLSHFYEEVYGRIALMQNIEKGA